MSAEERSPAVVFRHPWLKDGAEMWRVARDSQRLDLNTPYAYMLWTRDFHATSLVAEIERNVVGFVKGYWRPEEPTTLMIWQIAVDESQRGKGLAGRMLDELAGRTDAYSLETTIVQDNPESNRLFASFAERHGAQHTITDLFAEEHFPDEDDWQAELLHRITPLREDLRAGTTERA
ncbi:diaminobutyrate acetyltransferase [Demetria terragena]|uniref:diaminobutyrate acetyltransferase n=1 Tax=Demetria terragena TaxID=63959 RepID=UPI000371B5B2|nr:diaminobutyrate acetyltransferase [Demetria terragena]